LPSTRWSPGSRSANAIPSPISRLSGPATQKPPPLTFVANVSTTPAFVHTLTGIVASTRTKSRRCVSSASSSTSSVTAASRRPPSAETIPVRR
jgi:hypothetical protein